jgi:hypothetical protein
MPAREFTSGYFHLSLDGVDCGLLKSVEGGDAVADVVVEPAGQLPFVKKHLGRIRYTPLIMQFGMAMPRSVADWIAASWIGKPKAPKVTITTVDLSMNATSKREFVNALITEVTVPKMDGGSKEPGLLTLTVVPEYTATGKASGKVASTGESKLQKLWLASNFRLTIAGLDCTRVTTIDALTVRQSVAGGEIGERRDFAREVSRPEFPHLSITIGETGAQSWTDWFEDFVIKGNCDESREKQGSITMLGADLKEELARIDLFNLGIFALTHDKAGSNSDRAATVTARLYCERMELQVGPPAKPAVVAVKQARRRASGTARRRASAPPRRGR